MPKKTFEAWMAQVDAHLIDWHGLSSADLPDWDWWNAWNDGQSPALAAKRAFKAAGGY